MGKWHQGSPACRPTLAPASAALWATSSRSLLATRPWAATRTACRRAARRRWQAPPLLGSATERRTAADACIVACCVRGVAAQGAGGGQGEQGAGCSVTELGWALLHAICDVRCSVARSMCSLTRSPLCDATSSLLCTHSAKHGPPSLARAGPDLSRFALHATVGIAKHRLRAPRPAGEEGAPGSHGPANPARPHPRAGRQSV